jgi:hypothetical protein
MRAPMIALIAALASHAALAEADEDRLASIARFGGLAAVAPLCGLRDDGWAVDLRHAAVESATGSAETATPTVEANRAAAALGYGDMERLEDFAERAPAASCERLRTDPDLARADALVGAFRQRKLGAKPGS